MLVYGCQELFETRVSTEFENEVNMLSQVEHLNLVKLIGYLEEGDERILVTEFVTNGNLRQHLDGSPYGVILNMGTRLDIAIDIAHALTYLHYYTGNFISKFPIDLMNVCVQSIGIPLYLWWFLCDKPSCNGAHMHFEQKVCDTRLQ
jgi:hypothetical protein